MVEGIAANLAKGVAVVVALLVLRAVIGALERKFATKGVVCVLVNASSEEEAVGIGQTLVRERLAASANIAGRVRSIYHWEGKVEDRTETLVILKTTQVRVPALMRRAAELHSYAVPSIIALPLYMAHPPYGSWVAEATGGGSWRGWL